MILKKELYSKAINRINELQNETIQKANSIEGSKEFVAEQMKLFKEAEEYRHKLELVVTKQETVSKKFVG